MLNRSRFPLALLAAGLALAMNAAAADPSPQQLAKAPAASSEPRPTLTQSQALGVLSAINRAEVAAGKLAVQKTATGPVREYAQRMIKEHSENDQKLQAWSPDLAAPPATAQAAKGKQALATLSGAEEDGFRKAYLDAMVKDHGAALDALDNTLIPAATDAQVKTFLRETRMHVADHLAAAKRLQGQEATEMPQKEGPTG